MITHHRLLLALVPLGLCVSSAFPQQVATGQKERFLVIPNIHSQKSQDQIRGKALIGYHLALIAPHGDVALLEHNPAGFGPYAYDFLQCPNLWTKGECDSFLNRSGASGFRVLPEATDTFVSKKYFPWFPRFVSRFVLEKPPEGGTYSYSLKDKHVPEGYSPIVLMYASSMMMLSERSSNANEETGTGSYLTVGPGGSRKLIKKLNELGARGYRLVFWSSTARFGGPQYEYAVVHIPAESGTCDYALVSIKDTAEEIQQHLIDQGAKGFRPLAITPDNIVLERTVQGRPNSCSLRIVSTDNHPAFSAEIEKYLVEGYRLSLLVALNVRPSRFISFSYEHMQFDSSPIVILERCD